jgi:hypothetical protein
MMKLHTINYVKLYGAGDARLLLRFDDDARLELSDMVDLSPMLARGASSSHCAIRAYFTGWRSVRAAAR